MALTENEQIQKLITDARHVLITFRKDGKGDAIASACAMALFLERLGKQVDIVADSFELPKKFAFLKKSNEIQSKAPHLQKFMITIDVSEAGVQELSYDVKDQKLQIFVTPKSGFLTQEHVRTAQSEFRYDLIFVVDSPDLQSLGSLYEKHAELFHEVSIVNIDHQASNEHFGQVNLVDLTASSTAEIEANIMKKVSETDMTEEIATALLTGMIAATKSFKDNHIKPQTLSLASRLMHMGADREYIIKQLYQTKTLSTLRLWGEALAHLNFNKPLNLVSSLIPHSEFARSGATEQELYDIIDELMTSAPDAKLILLLHEHVGAENDTEIHGILHVEKGYNAKHILESYSPVGDHRQVSFIVKGKSLKQTEESITEDIAKKLAE